MPGGANNSPARAAVAHVFNLNPTTSSPQGSNVSGYGVITPVNRPAQATGGNQDREQVTSGYGMRIPANPPPQPTGGNRNPAQATSGYGVRIPANQPVQATGDSQNSAKTADGYDRLPFQQTADGYDLLPFQQTADGYDLLPTQPAQGTDGYDLSPVMNRPVQGADGYDLSPVMNRSAQGADGYDLSPVMNRSAQGADGYDLSPVLNRPAQGADGYDLSPVLNRSAQGADGYDLSPVLNQSPKPQPNPTSPTGDPQTGLRPLPLGDKYRGEEKGEGWRTGWKDGQGRQVKTEYFTEDKKNQSKVAFDDDARAANSTGVLEGRQGFVMDPTTGSMHVFTEGARTTKDTEVLGTHHSSPLGGKDVAGAGMVTFQDGRIANISDQSGHYKPSAEFTFQTVKKIAENAAKEINGEKKSPLWYKQTTASTESAGRLLAYRSGIETWIQQVQQTYPDCDVSGLQATLQEIDQAMYADDAGGAGDKEATVTLLGKSGMLSDEEYTPLYLEYSKVADAQGASEDQKAQALAKLKDDVNRISALKQLQAPLGEAAYAKLLLTKTMTQEEEAAVAQARNDDPAKKLEKKSGDSPIHQAMAENGIDPKSPDAAKKLKEILGSKAVNAIRDNDGQIGQLSQQYGIVAIDGGELTRGSERVSFEIGKATAATLSAEQFLQTEGNEAQIRTKKRLMDEIHAPRSKPLNQAPSPVRGEMSGKDQTNETPDKPDNATGTSASAVDGLLAALDKDPAFRKVAIGIELAQLNIDPNQELGNYNDADGMSEQKIKRQRWNELQEELRAIEESEQSEQQEPASGTDDPQETPEWRQQQDTAKQDAERLALIRTLIKGKVEKLLKDGLPWSEIHRRMHEQEKVSHEDLIALDIPAS
jgi:hypothetical protein